MTEGLTVVGRSSAVLAVSTGLIATVGLPGQAYGAEARTPPQSSTETGALRLPAAPPAVGLLAAPAITSVRTGPLSALTTATLAFESDAYTAVPTGTRHLPSGRTTTARHAVAGRSTPPSLTDGAPTAARTHHSASRSRAKAPVVKAPPSSAPVIRTPVTKAPVTKTPVTKTPVTRKPVTKTPVTKTPVTKTPVTKAPVTKAPVTKAPVAKAPVKHPKPPTPVHKPVSSPAPAGSARGSAVLAVAARYVGTPYVYGGTSPHGFDCSGFVGYVYRQLGVSLPRTANEQLHATHRLTRSQAQAGDLVFFTSGGRAYHVGIYAGHGQMYDSPHTGARVSKRKIWTSAVSFGRPTG